MATIVGEAMTIIFGNPDVLKICSVFAILISVLTAVVYMFKHIEGWR